MRKITMLGLLVLLAVLAMPTASALDNTRFYFVPQDGNASNCNDTVVQLRAYAPYGLNGGQFAINYSTSCIEIVDVEFNPVWWQTGWNNTPMCFGPGHDWIKFWMNMNLGPGDVWVCNITVNCTDPACTGCTTHMNFTCGVNCGGCGFTAGNTSGALPVNATNGTFTCGKPPEEPDEVDLNVTAIYLNPGNTRANETLRVYVNQSNDVCAVVYNDGPDDVVDDFDVCFEVDSTKICCVTVNVSTLPGGVLAAGASTTVCCNWTPSCMNYPVMPGYPSQSIAFTINVTADCNCTSGCCPNCPVGGSCGRINETDEANNTLSMYVPAIQPWSGVDRIGGVVNNAYKSKHCDCDLGDDPLSDYWVEYRDLTCGGIEWNVTSPDITLDNGSTDTRVQTIDLPCDASSVKKAMLFVYWRDYWTNTNTYPSGCLANLSANMSSVCGTSPNEMPVEATYHDTKGFGKYNSPMGVNIYNVTDWTCTNGGNPVDYTVNVTNIDPDNKTKLMGLMLVVIYEGDGDTLTHIWIHEGVDYLMAADATHGSYNYHVSPEEATATIPFSGTDTIPDNICEATLTTVVGNGMVNGAYALFNGAVMELDSPDVIAVDELDVTSNFAVGSTNIMEFMDETSNGFYAFNVFLVITEKQSVPTATGLGDAIFCVDDGCIEDMTALNVGDVCPPCNNPGWVFPYGLFEFNITCLEPGATVNVTIELPPGGNVTNYTKINTTDCTWYNVTPPNINITGNEIVGWNVTLTLTDGGLGDIDGVADGQITDPGGPSISGAVKVSIDPCPAFVCADPACRVTVNITLSGITDYGSGTIDLCYDNTVVNLVDVGLGDSTYVDHNSFSCGSGVCERISALNTDGMSDDVVFATVTFAPAAGVTSGCSDLNLAVTTLYDRNYTDLQTVVFNCTCLSGGLHITESDPPMVTACDASPPVILNDTGLYDLCGNCYPPRGRKLGTNVTNLSVNVMDATSVTAVYVNLTPILGNPAVNDEVPMTGPNGTPSGVWYWETNASFSNLTPYCLNVMAVDFHGNWENKSCITLEVQRRGDVVGAGGSDADNKVTGMDYYRIAKWTVGLEPEPNALRGNVVPAESWNGIDMADALYIAMHRVCKEGEP